jgi:hypothetical protein
MRRQRSALRAARQSTCGPSASRPAIRAASCRAKDQIVVQLVLRQHRDVDRQARREVGNRLVQRAFDQQQAACRTAQQLNQKLFSPSSRKVSSATDEVAGGYAAASGARHLAGRRRATLVAVSIRHHGFRAWMPTK